jgi:sialidase-1
VWENIRVVEPPGTGYVTACSPNLIRLENGNIRLVYSKYSQLENGKPNFTDAFYIDSSDEGSTFGTPEFIWKNRQSHFSENCILRLRSGRLLLPINCFEGSWCRPDERIDVVVMHSDDDGASWKEGKQRLHVPLRGIMEPHIAEAADGTLMMVMRTQLGSVFKSYSHDGGLTWTKPQTTGLRAPESCPCISAVPGTKKLLVIWNNSEYDMDFCSHYGKRSPLTAAVTEDNGESFSHFWDIETDPNVGFSNPGISWNSDGFCFLTYWAVPYDDKGVLSGYADMKLARFRIIEK